MTFVAMQDITRRLMVWAAVVAFVLTIPLATMQFTEEVDWDPFDFGVMGSLMLGVGLAYEMVARRSKKTAYRIAFALGLAAAFLLFVTNGAVGIIGSEDQPANMMYFGVLAVGLVGALVARFEPRGMSRALFAAALVQMLVPVAALAVWPPPDASWAPSVRGVFMLSAFFAALFFVSALLFRRAAQEYN